jgi:hypothetical protein
VDKNSSQNIKNVTKCEISGFRIGVVEVFGLLGCYSALVGSLPTFRDQPIGSIFKRGSTGCPETSVNYQQALRKNQKSENLILRNVHTASDLDR